MSQPQLTPFMDRACKLTFSPDRRNNTQAPLHHILQECLLSNNEDSYKTPVKTDCRFQDGSAFFQEMDFNKFDVRLLVSSEDESFDAYTPNHSRRVRNLVERARRLTRYSLDGSKSSPASSTTTINSESQDPRLVDLFDFPSDIELEHG